MGTLADRMELIKAQLAARYPARVITRSLKDFADRAQSDLASGIYTLVSRREGGYKNLNGREAMDGVQSILLVGQIELPETALPEQIEGAEFVMAEEIQAFVRDLPPQLYGLLMTGFRQSAQIEHPYGWIAVDLEYRP